MIVGAVIKRDRAEGIPPPLGPPRAILSGAHGIDPVPLVQRVALVVRAAPPRAARGTTVRPGPAPHEGDVAAPSRRPVPAVAGTALASGAVPAPGPVGAAPSPSGHQHRGRAAGTAGTSRAAGQNHDARRVALVVVPLRPLPGPLDALHPAPVEEVAHGGEEGDEACRQGHPRPRAQASAGRDGGHGRGGRGGRDGGPARGGQGGGNGGPARGGCRSRGGGLLLPEHLLRLGHRSETELDHVLGQSGEVAVDVVRELLRRPVHHHGLRRPGDLERHPHLVLDVPGGSGGSPGRVAVAAPAPAPAPALLLVLLLLVVRVPLEGPGGALRKLPPLLVLLQLLQLLLLLLLLLLQLLLLLRPPRLPYAAPGLAGLLIPAP